MTEFEVLSITDTELEPDVLLFSPVNPAFLVVGTYHLEQNGKRKGTISLFQVQDHSGIWGSTRPELLIVALSNGTMSLYLLDLESDHVQLHHIETGQCFPESTLILSLAVDGESEEVLATLSTGEVAVVRCNDITKDPRLFWQAHDLEVWCGAWKSREIILTGGDDARLKVWDLRASSQAPSAVSKRNMRLPISSVDLSGGVWRIIQQPVDEASNFLACCMQSGSRTVSVTPSQSISIEGTFQPEEENPLIYGACWQNDSVAALCSFYEKKLYICRPSIPIP